MPDPHGFAFAFREGGLPAAVKHAIPTSAFSKGDPLAFDSASSLSILPEIAAAAELAGVAESSSTESYRDQVGYVVPTPDSVFWSRATAGSEYTEGWELDIGWTSGSSIWMTLTSANTPRVVVYRGTGHDDMNQWVTESGNTFILVKFLSSSSGLLHEGTEF